PAGAPGPGRAGRRDRQRGVLRAAPGLHLHLPGEDRRREHGRREARAEVLLLHRRPEDPRGHERRAGAQGARRPGCPGDEGDRVTVEAGPRRLAGFHPNVIALGLTSFFTDVSTEMLVPVMPLFVPATLGASVASLGLIEGVAECTASALRLVAGRISDRIGRRKPFLLVGYGQSTAGKTAMALARSWPSMLGLRFGDAVAQ